LRAVDTLLDKQNSDEVEVHPFVQSAADECFSRPSV